MELIKEEGKMPVRLNEELVDELLMTGKYNLPHYYDVAWKADKITLNYHDLRTYALEAYADEYASKLPYLFDVFITNILKDYSPEEFYIEKLRRDIEFEYDPFRHCLRVSMRVSFKRKEE